MILVGDRNPVRKKKTVLIKHKDEVLSFITVKLGVSYPPPKRNVVKPTAPDEDFDLIAGPINAYWATLPEDRLDEIFEVYRDAKEILENADQQYTNIHNDLVVLVNKLYRLQPYEEIREFLLSRNMVKIPLDLKSEYDADSPDNGRTYLLGDYMELLCLSLALKPMLPIWGQYLEDIMEDIGTVYKEHHAAGLISKTGLAATASYQRLEKYIESYTSHSDDDIGLPAVLGCMSTVDFPRYLLNLLLLKKLCVAKMPTYQSLVEPVSLIREIYLYIKSKVEKPESIFMSGGNVKDKSKIVLNANGEDNTSKLEGIKLKEELDKGTIQKYIIQTRTDMFIPKRLDHTVPEEYVRASIRMMKQNPNLATSPVAVPLAQYVITGFKIHRPEPEVYKLLLDLNLGKDLGDGYIKSTIFNPRVIQFMEMEDRLLLMAYSQALLAHWGFYDLAALLTSTPTPIPSNVMMGQAMDPFNSEYVQAAIKLYPNLDLPPVIRAELLALRDKAEASAGAKQSYMKRLVDYNPALRSATNLIKTWSKYTWTLRVPKYLNGKTTMRSMADDEDLHLHDQSVNDNQCILPSTLKNELVKMVLDSKIKG